MMPLMGIESADFQRLAAGDDNCPARLDGLVCDLLRLLEESGELHGGNLCSRNIIHMLERRMTFHSEV